MTFSSLTDTKNAKARFGLSGIHKARDQRAGISETRPRRAGISEARPKRAGISLVEILVSLAIFSIGIVGLYLSIQGMNKNLQVSAQRDVEATYANMLISEVDPYNINVQRDEGSGGYDLTDTNNKGSITLPDGRTAYYLREVKSGHDTGDILEVNIYFYRNANDAASSPYRHFKRELPLQSHGYEMRATSTAVTRDDQGAIWTGLPRTLQYDVGNLTDKIAGMDITTTGALQNPAVDPECGEYHLANAASDRLIYIIPATENHEYKLELHFCEPNNAAVVGDRVMELVTSQVIDEIDIVEEAGAPGTFITKTYNVTPGNYLGVDFIYVELRRKSGTTDNSPLLQRFRIIR